MKKSTEDQILGILSALGIFYFYLEEDEIK